jgi:hypothetical protein
MYVITYIAFDPTAATAFKGNQLVEVLDSLSMPLEAWTPEGTAEPTAELGVPQPVPAPWWPPGLDGAPECSGPVATFSRRDV